MTWKLTPVMFVGAIYAVTVVGAQARCYSRWYYPYPQHCSKGNGVYARTTRPRAVLHSGRDSVDAGNSDNVVHVSLPDMSADWSDYNTTSLAESDQFQLLKGMQRLKAIRQLTQ